MLSLMVTKEDAVGETKYAYLAQICFKNSSPLAVFIKAKLTSFDKRLQKKEFCFQSVKFENFYHPSLKQLVYYMVSIQILHKEQKFETKQKSIKGKHYSIDLLDWPVKLK